MRSRAEKTLSSCYIYRKSNSINNSCNNIDNLINNIFFSEKNKAHKDHHILINNIFPYSKRMGNSMTDIYNTIYYMRKQIYTINKLGINILIIVGNK